MKKYLSKCLTNSEQKILYPALFAILLGLTLTFFDYIPQNLSGTGTKNDNDTVLEVLTQKEPVKFDLNTVTYEELLFLQGIGDVRAKAIIDYQQTHGFKSYEELANVNGFGKKSLDRYREILTLETVSLDSVPVNSVSKNTIDSVKKYNINSITYNELLTIKGIGHKRATDILDYRSKVSSIKNIDELLNIHGIGVKTLENLKDFLYVGE